MSWGIQREEQEVSAPAAEGDRGAAFRKQGGDLHINKVMRNPDRQELLLSFLNPTCGKTDTHKEDLPRSVQKRFGALYFYMADMINQNLLSDSYIF